MTAILIFKSTEGAGVGDYTSERGGGGRVGGRGARKIEFRILPNRPRPLGSLDTHARWVARKAKPALDLDDLTEKLRTVNSLNQPDISDVSASRKEEFATRGDG